MHPDDREAAMEWALDTWQCDVAVEDGAGDRHDFEVREMMRKALELAYSWGRSKEEAG